MSFIVQWRACPMLWIEYGPWLLLILTIPSQMHNIFQSNSSGFIKNLSQHFMFEQCHRLSGRDNPTCKFIVSIMDIDEQKRPCLCNMCKTRQYRMSRHYAVLRDWWPVHGWAEAPLYNMCKTRQYRMSRHSVTRLVTCVASLPPNRFPPPGTSMHQRGPGVLIIASFSLILINIAQ